MERLGQLLAARAPWWTARPTDIYWSTLGLFEPRLARSFGAGAIWLAGDAAHQAAPVGVHSMNSGLVEARQLATRMSRVLHAGATVSLLEAFAAATRETWHALLGGDVRALPGADPWVAQNRARICSSIPASGDDLETLLGQIGLAGAPVTSERAGADA